MLKTQIGLGVLSIPSVFDTLGMVPGAIILCIVALIATWTSYMVGALKMRYPEIYGFDDAGGLMFGRIGKEVFGIAFSLCKWRLSSRVNPKLTLQTGFSLPGQGFSASVSVLMPYQHMARVLLFSSLLPLSLDSVSLAFVPSARSAG